MIRAYYNEIDPYAAAWLRNLMAAGHIAPGDVDERSIEDIEPAELAQYTQCHFFAGIGVWSHALRLAGWPDDRPVWTGSCPCQPFSTAGKGAGFADERHLWPAFHWLIEQCRPPVVFGEQVASADGLAWLDLVQVDLEGTGYASAAADLCAAGVGAPHIRQRLYWVADDNDQRQFLKTARLYGRRAGTGGASTAQCGAEGAPGHDADGRGTNGRLDNNNNNKRLERHGGGHQTSNGHGQGPVRSVATAGEFGGLADAKSSGHSEHQRDTGAVASPRRRDEGQEPQLGRAAQAAGDRGEDGRMAHADVSITQQFAWGGARPCETAGTGAYSQFDGRGELAERQPAASPTNGFWADADWLHCRDGKWRPVEPGTFPLAHGAPARVGRLRAYGNAIVPQVAQTFIEAYLTHRP